jgi:RecA/RadA recombinase
MAKDKMDKEIESALDSINDVNPYASYLSESTLSTVDDWIDTGSMVLNALISGSLFKGVPKGRVVQFAGPSQTFKSGFVQQILANAQKKGMTVVIFDTENAIDPEGAAAMGLDISKVKYVPSTTIESTRNAIYKFLSFVKEKGLEGKFIIAIDSLANLQSEMELKRMDKDSTSADMGSFAKAIKSLLKTCTNMSTLTKTPIIVTNHVYDDPSAMYPSLEQHMAGGKAAVYLPSVTVQLARKLVKDDDGKTLDSKLAVSQRNYSGVVIRALTVKNRFIKQYLEGEMYLSFSTGLNKYYGLLEIMKGMGVIDNKGSIYYDWEDNKLGFQKAWRGDTDLWENRLLPELESRLKREWSYGNLKDLEDIPDEDETEDLEEEVEQKTENPLDKLKSLKNKVSSKLDDLEQEDEEED